MKTVITHIFKIFAYVTLMCFVGTSTAYCANVPNTHITPSTSLPPLIDYYIEGVTDDQSAITNPSGFATSSQTGVIDFRFSQPYDLSEILLWNGVKEHPDGIRQFYLEFFDTDGNKVSISGQFSAPKSRPEPYIYQFTPAASIVHVRMHVLRTHSFNGSIGLAMREIRFKIAPPDIPDGPTGPVGPTIQLPPWLLPALFVLAIGGGLFVGLRKWIAANRLKKNAIRRLALSKKAPSYAGLPKPERPSKSGVIFANSPLVTTSVGPGATAPLVPAGHLIPSGLQTLTGPFAALKPAYLATGRIGFAQEGVPTNDDVALGTGFLISQNHIMTNRHVYEKYKQYLTGKDCGGIEFVAEKDKDASDFVAFNGQEPFFAEGLDIAIFTLAHAVTDRTPINRVATPTELLKGRNIITIGYPCPFEVDGTILSVVETDPIFAVKRISQGKIFKHSSDLDAAYGVEINVDPLINATRNLAAICHNASTLGGNSGSPVLDAKTGALLGVHFAGFQSLNEQEAANLAMAIEAIAKISQPT